MEKYLSNCIDSILAVEEKDKTEIIIVNDGSKDASLSIAKNYEKEYPNIVKVVDKENGGYGSTINSGIKKATGRYFKVVDSDDWVNTKDLNALIAQLETENVDMIVSDYTCVYENDGKSVLMKNGEFEPFFTMDIDDKTLKHRLSMHMCFFRTELIENIKLLENCFYVDTEYVAFCVTKCKNFKYIPLNIYQYRLGRVGQSVSYEGYYNHRDDLFRVMYSLLEKYISENNIINKKYLHFEISALLNTIYPLIIRFYIKDKSLKGKIIELDEKLKSVSDELYVESGKCIRFGLLMFIRCTKYRTLGLFSVLKNIIK